MESMHGKKPLVTVLMAVHNSEKTLRQAITSILDQTFQDFEFVIINDGSTDGSKGIIESIMQGGSGSGSKAHPAAKKIVYIENSQKEGLPRSLNTGIDKARGAYICRMDADDMSTLGRLAAQVAFMEAHPEIGVAGTWAKIINDERPYEWSGVMKNPIADADIRGLLFFSCCIIHPSVIIRKDALDTHGLRYDEAFTSAQDYDLWSRAFQYTSFANIPKLLLAYRIHAESITNTKRETQKKNSILAQKNLIKTIGIDATERELSLHVTAKAADWSDPDGFLREKEVWLLKLKRALASHELKRRETRTGAFDKIFSKIWLSICIENAGTKIGGVHAHDKQSRPRRLRTFRAYWSSPLRKNTPKDMVRSLLLLRDK